ncbi:Beige/BEACH domain containing protein, partial [Trichomonas vaginalis G3]
MNRWFDVNIIQKFNRNRATTFSSMKLKTVDPKNSPDVRQFRKMVEKLNPFDQTDDIVEFFTERFKKYNEEQLIELEIEKETTKLIDVFSTSFLSHMADITVRLQGLEFLVQSCQLYDYTLSEENRLILIVSEIANSNDSKIINTSMKFVEKITSLSKFYPMFFTGDNLCTIWNSIFVSNVTPSQMFGPLFIKASKNYVPPNIQSIQKFLDKATGTFETKSLKPELQPRAIEFIGAVIYQIDTKEFVKNFFVHIKDDLSHLGDYQSVHNLLIAKSTDDTTIWLLFNEIFQQEGTSREMLLNALKTVHRIREHEQCHNFDLTPYVKICAELDKEYQRYLFETAQYYSIEVRISIFKETFPPWVTHVDSEMLAIMVTGSDWEGHYDELASMIREHSDFPTLYEKIIEDRFVNEICSYIFLHVSQDWADSYDCIKAGLDTTLHESDRSLKTIEAIATNVNPELYVEVLVEYLKQSKVNALVFNTFGQVAYKRKDFVKAFVHHKGLETLTKHLGIVPCLDFIALLASDGPHEAIDQFISQNDFHDLDTYAICRLMCGLPQTATELAVIRIPALCKYVDPNLETIYDKYVFGKYVERYMTPKDDLLMKAAHTYMSKDTAERYLKTPDKLLALLADIEPRGNLYQFHPRVPQNIAFLRSMGAISFWIWVQKNNGPTPLFTVAETTLSINENKFCINDITTECTLNHWHMITFVTKSLNPLAPTTTVYIDCVNFYTISGKGDITIGGPGQKSIWYMEEKVTDSSNITEESLRETYDAGPHSSKSQVKLDLLYVPYGGVIANFPAYGGNDIFWNACFNCKLEVHMRGLIESAFSLAQSGVFTMDELFKGFKATFIQRPDLLTTDIAQCLVETSSKDPKSSPELLRRLFGSFFYLAAPNVDHTNLPEVIERIADPSDILSILLMSVIFFDLNEETVNRFFEVIEKVVKSKPTLVKKLLTFARGLPFIDEETIKTPEDPRFDVHQDRVLDIAIKAGFPQKADEILDSFLTLSQRQMLVIFKLFTKKCIANNTFFDVKTFQALEQGLQGFVLNEEMWLCMLSLVGSYEIKTFKDFNIAEIQEPNINVVHMMISLTTVLLQRVTNDPENELARTIVSIVCKIVVELSKKGEDIIQHFAPLCAVGYNQFQPTPFPHTLAPDESIKTIDAASPKKPDYITVEDMTLVEDEMSKIENCPEPKYKQPEDVTFDDNTASAREISRTASTLLAQSTVNLSSFKKALYLLTVQGADVNPTVAVIMHRSIISDFIAIINDQGEEYTLPQDINSYLLEFISARLMEGWWKDYENIIIRQIFNLHPINEAAFYPVCLITDPVGSAEKVISSSVFSGFTREEDNCAFIAKVILDNEDFPPDCIDLLINKSLNSKFSDALKKDKLNAYFTQEIKDKAEKFKEGAYNQIKKDEPAAHQLRFKMSSRPQSQLFNHRRNVSSFICRQYMKRRFAIVYNMNCVDSEEIIGRVFQTQQQQKYFLNPTEKYCVQRSSSPLSVPSKVIPLTYEFVSPHQRSTNSLQFVMSQHETYLKFTVDSMRHPQSASQCLTGIHLPLYIYDGIVCAKVFMEKFGVQSLFQCSLFMSSELLSCVGALTKETFILLMNASYKDGSLTVYKGSQTLCSYEPLEDSTAGLWGESTLFFHNPVLLMEIDGISKIEKRRFVYEQRALDIFMCDGRHITLILDENERKTFLSKIKPPKDDDLLSKPIAEITKMWCKGDITTYDYLLAVNDLGGRSFNDFSQYPVFPWVIGDYTHDPPTKMRDLTKPMGMQTEERAKRFITTYEESPEHYHYGTHYSHPAAVFHFMLRLEPYTLFFFHLHSGWDHRDRIFCDVNDSWLSASETNQTDLKELIPEFFSFPMFLKNTNDLPIQDRTDGKKISNVILPPWGADPLQFIWRNRIALENQDISPWIDLIFGYKSRGQGAKDANNLFLPTAYSLTSNIRDENGEIVAMDPQGQADAVNNFGQCPIQVFQQQHPPRDVAQLVTIINSPMYINITKLVTPEGVNKVYNEEGNIVFTGDHESRLGFSKRRIDECVSYTNSPDSSMVAVASPHGIVTITFALNYSTKNIALPGSMPVCLCLPRLGHFLLVSTEKGLYVFDIVSGFLSMKKDLAGIKAIAYDDISHVIYAMTDNKIYCIYSDFTDIADIELSEECISITDSARTSFDEKPFFAVGFANGH